MNLITLINLVRSLFNFYSILIVIYCLLSFIPRGGSGLLEDFRAALDTIVGSYINVFRRFIPPFGMLDFSPVIAILVLTLVENLVLRLLLNLAI